MKIVPGVWWIIGLAAFVNVAQAQIDDSASYSCTDRHDPLEYGAPER